MSPLILLSLLTTLGIGTLIAISSSHWLIIWVGLELNTLAIIPLIVTPPRPRAVEAATKYFLVQASAAATLLFAATTNAWFSGQWEITQISHPAATALSIIALSIKLGLAPTHLWLPEVMQGLTLTTGLILSTWQKLAPFVLLIQIPSPHPSLLITIGLLSIIAGGWGGLNQVHLRKILAYSSTAHLGWIILVTQFSPYLGLLALALYLNITSSAFLTLKIIKSTTINSLAISWVKSPSLAALTPLILLSIAGLPPLTGFISKWFILHELTKQGLALTATVAAISSLLSLYFYLRLAHALALTSSPNTFHSTIPWRLSVSKTYLPLAITCLPTLAFLPLTPLITSFFLPFN